jgi:hypothetical protein
MRLIATTCGTKGKLSSEEASRTSFEQSITSPDCLHVALTTSPKDPSPSLLEIAYLCIIYLIRECILKEQEICANLCSPVCQSVHDTLIADIGEGFVKTSTVISASTDFKTSTALGH